MSRAEFREGRTILAKLSAELERRGITAEEIGRLARLSLYQGMIKNADNEIEVKDLYAFKLAPEWDSGPKWPVMKPGPTLKLPAHRPKPVSLYTGQLTTLILPDMQIGYYRDRTGSLVSTHDEDALNVALELIVASRPDTIIALGDNLDLPEMSRYRLSPAFHGTMQPTIDFATTLFGRIRAAAPDAEIHWLAGNHEERLQNYVMDNATAAFGLRTGNAPESWPVLSVPNLCRLVDVGVTYHPGYPRSDIWITPNLKVIHGNRVKSKGSTAHLYLNESKVSVIYGHIHRIERAHRTREDYEGMAEIMAASPGCLAKKSGAVPSTNQGLDLDGRPLTGVEDWQQGLAIVTSEGDQWDYEQVRIDEGRAWWRGHRYGATG